METVNWKVEGMSCSNCALTIGKYLEKEGLQNIKVNLLGGDVSFALNGNTTKDTVIKGIESLGYHVVTGDIKKTEQPKRFLSTHLQRFVFCLVFATPLLLHMLDKWIPMHWLMDPWIQLVLCLPVYIVGMNFFGKSAVQSIRNGMPNMNVLVTIGATAAFVYSLTGTLLHLGEGYLFYETAAAIITLIFLGNYIEELTIQSTQKALNSLTKSQKLMANMIAFDDQHQEQVFPVESTQLRSGDIIVIKSGEQVPADCKILWGEASVSEAIITGESLPVAKHAKDKLIGGSLFIDGTVKAQVTAAANDSVLSHIINLVKQAQGEKPPVQQLADKISAVFVPIVLSIAALTFLINELVLHDLTASIMRSIAVLVIACPCAMGLATPAAIAVGLGRAAKNGILFRNAKSLELFKDIQQVVFDKTGTLTTGEFVISQFQLTAKDIDEEQFKKIIYSLEKFSNHPIAKSIATAWKVKQEIRWNKMEEIKGIGMQAETTEGDIYKAGSYQVASNLTTDGLHNVYVVKNDQLIGWIDVKDKIRPETKSVIGYFKNRGIKTILLSGDRKDKCEQLAAGLGIDEVIAEQTPQQKLDKLIALNAVTPTAMIGDGINDAPALAKASIGISMSDASHIAMQTADVVLMNNGIKHLPMALGLGKHTFITIKQNLFWAFFYNVVAIPVAAFGLLSPPIGALVMGLSDVVLAVNSMRLFVKKVN
jgi:Cu+-exporting ATPase